MSKETKLISYEERIHPFTGSRVKLMQAWIPHNAINILDLGCAYGYISTRLATSERRVYGIDVNYNYIAEAYSNYSNADFSVGTAEGIPFADNYFDCIVMTEVLEHVMDQRKSLTEVYRVLVPGGALILTVPHIGPLSFLDPENLMFRLPRIRQFLFRLKWGTTSGMMPKTQEHRHYSLESIKDLMGSGFVVEKVYRSGFLIYPIATLLKPLFKNERLNAYLNSLLSWDYAREYGVKSCNIALQLRKI